MSDRVILIRNFLASFLKCRHFFSHYYAKSLILGIQHMLLPHGLILIALIAFSQRNLDLSTSFCVTFFPFACSLAKCPILLFTRTSFLRVMTSCIFLLQKIIYNQESLRLVSLSQGFYHIDGKRLGPHNKSLLFQISSSKFYDIAFFFLSTQDSLAKLGEQSENCSCSHDYITNIGPRYVVQCKENYLSYSHYRLHRVGCL
uniref:Uncharacterized protein n=1 Tax=Cucumis melo TaxID=3656 RepID=A0A9I9ED90_CUCME